MRARVLGALLVPLGGCAASWTLLDETGCSDPVAWFLDRDGDGWGDPAIAPTTSCAPNPEAGLVARNGLDCLDDPDDPRSPRVTGRIGDVCPQVLAGRAPETLRAGVVEGREFALVEGAAPQVTRAEAEAACARWGGALATLSTLLEYGALWPTIESPAFAGHVDLVEGPSGWSWTDGEGVPPGAIGWCDREEARAPVPYAGLGTPVWVRRDGRSCFGEARDAGPSYPDSSLAHPICERAAPDPADWSADEEGGPGGRRVSLPRR